MFCEELTVNTTYSNESFESLFSDTGERKYLNADERKRFYQALPVIENLAERAFVEFIFWTGCRISEALEMVYQRVNVESASVALKSKKKRGKLKNKHFRIVPVPRDFMTFLDKALGVSEILSDELADHTRQLWYFKRKKGGKLVEKAMIKAAIFGIRATSRGLRHTFGVHCILKGVPEIRLQRYMGHSKLRSTAKYVQLVGMEDREILSRTWVFD